MHVCRGLLVLFVGLAIVSCSSALPDQRGALDELAGQLRPLPGVVAVGTTVDSDPAQGPPFVEVDVAMADQATSGDVAAVTARYLSHLRTADGAGYRAELEIRAGANVFVVNSGDQPVADAERVVAQAREWVRLREQVPGSAVTLRAGVNGPSAGRIELSDAADYTAVASTVAVLGANFADLAAGDWVVTAGNRHPAEIHTSRRLPSVPEMALWTQLNGDQSIPHAVVMTINGDVTGPVWISEKIGADNLEEALLLAQRHLPLLTTLPTPVLYTASNQYQGHLGFRGQAVAAVAITVGGCTVRTYRPSTGERALIDQFEICRR